MKEDERSEQFRRSVRDFLDNIYEQLEYNIRTYGEDQLIELIKKIRKTPIAPPDSTPESEKFNKLIDQLATIYYPELDALQELRTKLAIIVKKKLENIVANPALKGLYTEIHQFLIADQKVPNKIQNNDTLTLIVDLLADEIDPYEDLYIMTILRFLLFETTSDLGPETYQKTTRYHDSFDFRYLIDQFTRNNYDIRKVFYGDKDSS